MFIKRLELTDFRSYRRFELEPARGLTVLVGKNAAGKTNIIEAIEIISSGRSFRNPRWCDLVRRETTAASIEMVVADENGERDVDLLIEHSGARRWRVCGSVKRRVIDATKFVPVVVFTPDDLALAKGPAEGRRLTVDLLGDQLSATYGTLRREYTRVVRHRNAALKESADGVLAETLDEQLVSLGARLHVHRRRLAARVGEVAARVYGSLASGEGLAVEMHDRCGIGDPDLGHLPDAQTVESEMRAELAKRRRDEIERGVTLVGPHRDDLVFVVGGVDARAFASQGQQRTIALAWKLAEVQVIEDVLRKVPVLLLDDVMSELDETRRHALTELVNRDVQTFITATDTSHFEPRLLAAAAVVEVERGN